MSKFFCCIIKNIKLRQSTLTLLVGLMLAVVTQAHAQVNIELFPKELSLGQSAELSISAAGNLDGSLEVPAIDGLRIRPAGKRSQIQIINGNSTSSVSYLYRVEPTKVGEYTIPAIKVALNGKSYTTQPIAFRVDNSDVTNRRSASSLDSSNTTVRSKGTTIEDESNVNWGKVAYLKISALKKRIYVGQILPIQISAYFSDAVRPRAVTPPNITSSAFEVHKISAEPSQNRIEMNGHVYTVLSWDASISAIKEGSFAMDSELEAQVLRRSVSRRSHSSLHDSFFGKSFFGDDIFDDFFSNTHEESLTLSSKGAENTKFTVMALPKTGRPRDYSGAVGDFKISSSVDLSELSIGDPLTLKVKISGQGNFERLSKLEIKNDIGWKSYPPSAVFTPLDVLELKGEKNFEQILIANDSSITHLPEVMLSYFNPRTEKYLTLKAGGQAISVAVLPVNGDSGKPQLYSLPKNQSQTYPGTTKPKDSSTSMVEKTVWNIKKVLDKKLLIIFSIALLVLVLVIVLVLNIRRRNNDPLRLRAQQANKASRGALKQAKRAAREGNSTMFFKASCRAIQEKLALAWGVKPESITATDIRTRCPQQGEKLAHIFELADAVKFSGKSFDRTQLDQINAEILGEIESIH